MPFPDKETLCGLPAALLMIASAPARVPMAVGVNVTLMLQLAPAASVAGLIGQLLVRAKSPLGVMPIMLSGALPVLDNVTT